MKTTTVYACESQPIVVEGLRSAVREWDDLDLVGDTQSITDAILAVGRLHPDVVLVDQLVVPKSILEVIPRIRAISSVSQTVLWVTDLTEMESFRALQSGARGILKKTLPVSSVIDCIRAVGQGNIWIENSISNQVVGFLNRRNLPRLTPRELEIVSLICRGMKNKQIADTLSITTGTVKVHLMHIFEKTGVKDRFELALEAHKLVGSEPVFGSQAAQSR